MKDLNEPKNRIEALKSGMTEREISLAWTQQNGYVVCEIVRF